MIDIQSFKISEDFTQLRSQVGEYSFVVFGLQRVRVKIWYNATPQGTDHYTFTQSHCFGEPPDVSTTFASTEELALRKAMGTLQTYFPPENSDGNQSSWLVENKNF
jgi:hypothetical protein